MLLSHKSEKSPFLVNGSKHRDTWLFKILKMVGHYGTTFNHSIRDAERSIIEFEFSLDNYIMRPFIKNKIIGRIAVGLLLKTT